MDDEKIMRELSNYLSDSAIFAIIDIISRERQLEIDKPSKYEQIRAELRDELFTVIQSEVIRCDYSDISPAGPHIIVIYDRIILIDIHGCWIILSNYLFLEGELVIRNLRRIEDESIVVFDLNYIVHQETQHVICYYDADDIMVWKGRVKKIREDHCGNTKKMDIIDLNW